MFSYFLDIFGVFWPKVILVLISLFILVDVLIPARSRERTRASRFSFRVLFAKLTDFFFYLRYTACWFYSHFVTSLFFHYFVSFTKIEGDALYSPVRCVDNDRTVVGLRGLELLYRSLAGGLEKCSCCMGNCCTCQCQGSCLWLSWSDIWIF